MTTAARASPRRMSLDEWASLPEDEPGELVGGELVEEEVPGFDHESVVAWLIVLLGGWFLPRGGFVFASEGKFALRPGVGCKRDLRAAGRRLPPRPRRLGGHRRGPDLDALWAQVDRLA